MAQASVTRNLDVPAQALFDLLADFGNVSWMPAGTQADVVGEGPGMARLIHAGDRKIREQLESLDPATRTLVYTIPENVPFPVTGYRATMVVTPQGEGCELRWTCSFEPEGVSEEQARGMIEGLYVTMIGWLEAGLSGGGAS